MSKGALPSRLVLLGHPVAHSLSPVFQNAALTAAGIAIRYEALDVAPHRLGEVLEGLVTEGAAGNATVPHKLAVASRCATLSAEAARTGAVNTFRARDGVLEGHNTDVDGFDAACSQLGVRRAGARIWCVGTGGAARAVCAATERWPGASVRLMGRRRDAMESLSRVFPHVADAEGWGIDQATLVVNATPLGLPGEPDHDPVAVQSIPRDAHVMDLVYRRDQTPWVRRCTTHGLQAIDGLEMLLQQGALAFEYWLGMRADLDVMRRSLAQP